MGFEKLDEMLEIAQYTHRAPRKQLEAMCWAYWEFASNNKELFQVMLRVELTSSFSTYLVQEFPLRRLKPVIEQLLVSKKKGPLASQERYFQFFSLIQAFMPGSMYESVGKNEEKHTRSILKEKISGMIKSI